MSKCNSDKVEVKQEEPVFREGVDLCQEDLYDHTVFQGGVKTMLHLVWLFKNTILNIERQISAMESLKPFVCFRLQQV